jgi:hypothetical protein
MGQSGTAADTGVSDVPINAVTFNQTETSVLPLAASYRSVVPDDVRAASLGALRASPDDEHTGVAGGEELRRGEQGPSTTYSVD